MQTSVSCKCLHKTVTSRGKGFEKVRQAHSQWDYGNTVNGTSSVFWGFQKLQECQPRTTMLADGHRQLSQTTHPLTAPEEQETTAMGQTRRNMDSQPPSCVVGHLALMCCRTSRAPAPQKPLLHQRFLQPSSHAARPSCSSPTPPHHISCLPVHTEALAKPSMELQCCATLFFKKK